MEMAPYRESDDIHGLEGGAINSPPSLRDRLALLFRIPGLANPQSRAFIRAILNSKNLSPINRANLAVWAEGMSQFLTEEDASPIEGILQVDHVAFVYFKENGALSICNTYLEGVDFKGNILPLEYVDLKRKEEWTRLRSKEFIRQHVRFNSKLSKEAKEFIANLTKGAADFCVNGGYYTLKVYEQVAPANDFKINLDSDALIQPDGKREVVISQRAISSSSLLEWHYPLDGSEPYLVMV